MRFAFGGMAAIVKRAAQAEAAVRRPALDRGDAARRAAGAGRRLRAAQRHARERRLPPAGGAEPAAPLLARDAAGRAARRARRPASGARCRMPRRSRRQEPRREPRPRPALAGRARRRRRGRRPGRRVAAARVGAPARRRRGALHRRPARARRHAARRARPVAGGARPAARRSTSTRIAAVPGVVAVLTAADIPGPNDCGPIVHDDPILADGEVHYLGQPVFAVIATTRDAARRAAAQAKAALRIEPLPAAADAGARRTPRSSYVLPPMHLARGDARAAIAAAPHRLADTLEVGGQEQFYLEGQISYAVPREDDGMLVHCSTQHPSEMQHLVAHCAGPALAPGAGRVPAHGRRLRRQGVAVGAVRLRRRDRGAEARPAGQAAPRPRRRLPGHRPAPLLPLRLRGRLRRRRPHPRRRADDGLARRLLGRPVGPGDDARDLPLRQRLLAARRRDPRLLGHDQHAEQHRVSRLRRAAGRDRDREHPRLDRARRSARIRSTCAGSTSTARARAPPARRAQRHAVRPGGRRQRRSTSWSPSSRRRSDYRARRDADRRVQRRRARCSSAASRSRR